MENKDFVIEQILSIEDFDNVDEKLAKIIADNDEYRRIFEEYKELSKLISESVPEPGKDGVSLYDAVMGRVRSGDTAPKYINTSKFRFPIATVACLVLIAVTAFVAVNSNGINRNNMRDQETNGAFVQENVKSAPMEIMDTSFGILATDDMCYADEEDEAEAEHSASGNAENVFRDTKVALYSAPLSEEFSTVEYSENDTEAEEKTSDGGFKYSAIASQNAMYDNAVTQDSVTESSVEEETIKEADLAEIYSRMEYAKERVPAENLITLEKITELGQDKYILWFDSIVISPDFAELYSVESFTQYCNK